MIAYALTPASPTFILRSHGSAGIQVFGILHFTYYPAKLLYALSLRLRHIIFIRGHFILSAFVVARLAIHIRGLVVVPAKSKF
jgi:hypothetical protein